jgi:hypothetical protein
MGGGGGACARSTHLSTFVFRKLIVFVAVLGSSIKTHAVALAMILKRFVESVNPKETIFRIFERG